MADYNSTFTGAQVDASVQKSIDLYTASRINTSVTKTEALDTASEINDAVDLVNAMPTPSAVTQAVTDATKVVANETLAGTETTLTEITVGTTKYKVPQAGSAPSNMVTTDSAQNILADKTFVGTGGDARIYFDRTNGVINFYPTSTKTSMIKANGVDILSMSAGTYPQVGSLAYPLLLLSSTDIQHKYLNGTIAIVADSSNLIFTANSSNVLQSITFNGQTYTIPQST